MFLAKKTPAAFRLYTVKGGFKLAVGKPKGVKRAKVRVKRKKP